MIAIDTNIVVRYLTGEHPDQSARARALVDAGTVFVPIMVLLEAEWLLRSAYGQQAPDVARALRAFGGLPGVTYDDAPVVAQALDRAEGGMDFADALLLGKSEESPRLMIFDQKFIKAAQRAGVKGVTKPWSRPRMFPSTPCSPSGGAISGQTVSKSSPRNQTF